MEGAATEVYLNEARRHNRVVAAASGSCVNTVVRLR
eukprot:gene16767-11246_t